MTAPGSPHASQPTDGAPPHAPPQGASSQAAPALPFDTPPWGICFSGGGIRSASFSLGVLQEMHDHEMLVGTRRAHYLAAVSGGSYLAGAFTLTSRGAYPWEPSDDDTTPEKVVVTPTEKDPAFRRNSPEERLLRDRTRYLTHGRGGPIAVVWRLVVGIVVNLLLLGLALHALFRPVGWIYGHLWPQFTKHAGPDPRWTKAVCQDGRCAAEIAHGALHLPKWIPIAVAVLGVAALIAAIVWVLRRWRDPEVGSRAAVASGALAGCAGLVLVLGVVVPHVLQFVRVDLARHGVGHTPVAVVHAPTTGTATTATAADTDAARTAATSRAATHTTKSLFAGLIASLIGTVLTVAGATTVGTKRPLTLPKGVTSFATRFAAKHRMQLLNLAASIFGPLLLIVVTLYCISLGAATPIGGRGVGWWPELARWAAPTALLLFLWWLGDVTAWSMHPFYKDRLAAAFALRRVKCPSPTPTSVDKVDAEERPLGCPYPISASQPPNTPKLLVCAAANVSNYGATPTGSDVASFVFSADEVGIPTLPSMRMDTRTYETRTHNHWRNITLPAAMAMSGAAVSPSMGKMTRRPLRFLLALANVRLGVWMPNPKLVADDKNKNLHRYTPPASGTDRFGADAAVIRAVYGDTPIFRYRSWPRPDYLLRELFGRNRLDAPYLYVTDGGHYENLGLVELLRRRCRWIWCVDGAGDAIDTFNTLGEALGIADAELDVRIEIHPEEALTPDLEKAAERLKEGKPPFSRGVCTLGKIRYPDGTEGTLVYLKAGVTEDAPWAVRSFHERNPRFPCDPTSNQLYTADRFDAYRMLGGHAMQTAWRDHGAAFDEFRRSFHTARSGAAVPQGEGRLAQPTVDQHLS